MVGFGSSLRMSRRRGWEDAYLDYASLRLLLTQIEAVYEEEDWKARDSAASKNNGGAYLEEGAYEDYHHEDDDDDMMEDLKMMVSVVTGQPIPPTRRADGGHQYNRSHFHQHITIT
eukprot:scaffold758_cov116-Skeletonema_marinoi.AAC.5